MGTFTRFVEVGRIVYINYGPEKGRLATIVDVVDQNKCLVEGPADITGVSRQVLPYKRISLTDLKVAIPRNARAKADTLQTWEASSWAKKLENKKRRGAQTDFMRFKVMVARKQKSVIVKKKMKEMKA